MPKARRTKDPGQDPHWKDVKSPTSWQHFRPVPYKRDPHDKSPPSTTILRLARQVSTSHDKSPPRMTSLCLARPPPSSDWCRMDLPGPTTSVGTRTDYSVGPWDYSTCATWHMMAWGARTTVEEYSNRKLCMSGSM
jgi:hypothetical protein